MRSVLHTMIVRIIYTARHLVIAIYETLLKVHIIKKVCYFREKIRTYIVINKNTGGCGTCLWNLLFICMTQIITIYILS